MFGRCKQTEKRNAGEPIKTPRFTRGSLGAPTVAGTLRDAVAGWEKERARSAGTVHEFIVPTSRVGSRKYARTSIQSF
jgi:hypothetical protein